MLSAENLVSHGTYVNPGSNIHSFSIFSLILTEPQGMESLIRQASLHIESIGKQVKDGHYDLLGPSGEIFLPQIWETTIKPGMRITMHMWPTGLPNKKAIDQ